SVETLVTSSINVVVVVSEKSSLNVGCVDLLLTCSRSFQRLLYSHSSLSLASERVLPVYYFHLTYINHDRLLEVHQRLTHFHLLTPIVMIFQRLDSLSHRETSFLK